MKPVLLILILSFACFANIEVTAPVTTQLSNSTFTVPITLTGGLDTLAYQLNILYDPAVITPSGPNFGCSLAGTFAEGDSVLCNVTPDGTLRTVVWGAYSLPAGKGTVLNITFSTNKRTGVSPLVFDEVYFFNSTGFVPVNTRDGEVTVAARKGVRLSVF